MPPRRQDVSIKVFPLGKERDGAGEVLRRLHAVAEPSGGCLEKQETRESVNRNGERRQHFRAVFEVQDNPRAFGAAPFLRGIAAQPNVPSQCGMQTCRVIEAAA